MSGNLGIADGSDSEKEVADDEEEEEEEEERGSDDDPDDPPHPTLNILSVPSTKKPTPQSTQPGGGDDSVTGKLSTLYVVSRILTVIRV